MVKQGFSSWVHTLVLIDCVVKNLLNGATCERDGVFLVGPRWVGEWCIIRLSVMQALPFDKNCSMSSGSVRYLQVGWRRVAEGDPIFP